MTDINLKTLTPDTSLPTTGFLFGADSQASTNPSVYSTQTVATTLLGSTSLTGDTLTADAPVLNLAQTWNNSGTTFTGVRFNAAGTSSTNSAAASLLMDLQVGGATKFKTDKNGNLASAGNFAVNASVYCFSGTTSITRDYNFATVAIDDNMNGVYLASNKFVSWAPGTNLNSFTQDLYLRRKGAANIQLGEADAATALAQTLSVQSVVAGTTDGAGQPFTFTGSQSTGTGVPGNILIQTASSAATTGSAQNALATVATFGPSTLRLAQTTPALDLAQTWNTSGNATGLKLNVTNTASGASSLLMDLQVGTVSRVSITKDAYLTLKGTAAEISIGYPAEINLLLQQGGIINSSVGGLYFSSSSTAVSGGNIDLALTRKGAANLRLGRTDAASPVAQTLSVQSIVGGVSTDASAAAYPFTITGSQGTGTGAGGSIVFQVAPAGGSGTAQNSLATALTINSAKQVVFDAGSASAPSIRGTNADSGIYFSGNNIRLAVDGSLQYLFAGGGNTNLVSTAAVQWANGGNLLGTYDVLLFRDTVGTLAQRNGTTAQEFRVYETTTGSIYKAILGNRQLIKISGAAFDNGAGASAGTLTNAPAVGNPTKWIPIDDNGTTRYIPAW